MTFTDAQLDTYATADKAMDAIQEHLNRFGLDLPISTWDDIQTELVHILKNSEVEKG